MPTPWEEAAAANQGPAKMPWEEAASASPTPPAVPAQTSMWDGLKSKVMAGTESEPVTGPLSFVRDTARRVGRNLFSAVDAPVQQTSHLIKGLAGDQQEAEKWKQGIPQLPVDFDHPGPHMSPEPLPYTKRPTLGENLADLVGDLATAELTRRVPGALDTGGQALKSAAGKVADVAAVGSNALDRQFGAQPGRALSENRIIGATTAGLKKKVDASIGPKVAERQTVLQAAPPGPYNVRPDVDQPFADLTSKVTGKTGVAAPAEIASLTRSRAAAGFEQDPMSGKPLIDPVTRTPVVRDLEHMSPPEIAQFNSNLRSMGNYEAQSSPLADQAIKGAGYNLRNRLAAVAPESVDLTRQIHNSETASEVLGRNLSQSGKPNLSPYALYNPTYGMVANVVRPLTRPVGTALAAGMDVVGSGMRSLASKLNPPGPPPAGAGRPQPPQPQALPPQLPNAAGAGAPQPPVVPPPVQPGIGAPPPLAGQLPATAGMSQAVPSAAPPPNVSLTERVAPRPGETLTQSSARPGGPAPAPGTGGLSGPESRVTTRTSTGFGPKKDAPAFTIPKKKLTDKASSKENK